MVDTRDQLAAQITEAVRQFQDATDLVDHAGAEVLGVNRTDLRCLALLGRRGTMTAGQMASEIGLTTGVTTTAIDRLVRRRYVERIRDDQDRRRITIAITPEANAVIEKVWGPLGEQAQTLLVRRSNDELKAILDFLREGVKFQTEHADRIRRQGHLPT